MDKAFIIKKGEKLFFDLPSKWNLVTFAAFEDRFQAADVHGLSTKALKHTIGSPPLRERLSPSNTVAILVEDLTRASPKGIILKTLLEELAEIGIPDGHITIVIALGTHRGLTPEELETTFRADLATRT